MAGPLAARQVEEILKDAYPDERERAHATRWLGWIASHPSTHETFKKSDLPKLLPQRSIPSAWVLVFALVAGVGYGTGLLAGGLPLAEGLMYAFPALLISAAFFKA